jgi:hypothetical protein
MMDVIFQYGMNYLVFTGKIDPVKQSISKNEKKIIVGDKISQIGSKKRSWFKMEEGKYMIYEGILNYGNVKLAIFNCPEHNSDATSEKKYRYVFHIVELEGKFECFLLGGRLGMRDVQLDFIKLFNEKTN